MSVATKTSNFSLLGQTSGFVVGLTVTAMAMSSGFIWASQGEIGLVYIAGFFSWTGYLVAHYAATGVFVDNVDGPDETTATESHEMAKNRTGSDSPSRSTSEYLRTLLPEDLVRFVGFLAGIAILVAGIAILAWFVRQENHLLGNLGSGMFLAGYVVAHYFDSGKLL